MSSSSSSSSSPLTSVTSPSLHHHHHRRRRRSLSNTRQLESTSTNSSWDSLSIHGQQFMDQPADVANQFQQLHVHSDVNITTSHASSLPHESLAEEQLIERLKAIINEFMTRPGRRYSYDTIMHWTVDYGNELHYSVVIKINQATNRI